MLFPKVEAQNKWEKNIPVTYVPARNTIFLSYALAWAEVVGANDILLDVNALDYSGYPTVVRSILPLTKRSANLATEAGVTAGRN